jgi:hypothetical protein
MRPDVIKQQYTRDKNKTTSTVPPENKLNPYPLRGQIVLKLAGNV